MPKDKKQKLVLTIGEERPGFSAHLGEIVYIASPGHKWGREEKPPRFQFVNEELSAEEERDLLTKLWKRDFNRSVWTSRLVANLDWDKNRYMKQMINQIEARTLRRR